MEISWKGDSSVDIKTKKGKVSLNPGKKDDLKSSNVVIYDKTDAKREAPKDSLLVDWPGEYDTSGFSFKGVEIHGDKGSSTAYVFHSPDGNVAWMGELADYPSDKDIEAMGEVNVLLVPVGDKGVLNGKNAFKLVEALEPNVVIPICHGDKRDGLAPFLKEMDVKMPEPKKSFAFKRSALMGEQLELVILEK